MSFRYGTNSPHLPDRNRPAPPTGQPQGQGPQRPALPDWLKAPETRAAEAQVGKAQAPATAPAPAAKPALRAIPGGKSAAAAPVAAKPKARRPAAKKTGTTKSRSPAARRKKAA
jgi:hypothetical protein